MTEIEWVKERRIDGRPLCPQCGEDELYSLSLPACQHLIDGCYRCGWKPDNAQAKKVVDRP